MHILSAYNIASCKHIYYITSVLYSDSNRMYKSRTPRVHTTLLFPSLLALLLQCSLSLSVSDGSITGAMLRELLQPSLSGGVSSNVGAELSNLLTMQEKRKETRRKKSFWSPNDTRREPSCAKFCRVALPCFLSRGPRTPIYRQSHIGLFCMVWPKQLRSAEKHVNNKIKINKQINKQLISSDFLFAICRKWTI